VQRRSKVHRWGFGVFLVGTATLTAAALVAASGAGASGRAGHRAQVITTARLGNLTTYHYDNRRSGSDAVDPALSKLHLAWDDGGRSGPHLDGAEYGEPLAYRGLVVVATENDSVYGIEARTGKIRWHLRIGDPVYASSLRADPDLGGCGNIFPSGITGTPVIDRGRNEVFVVGERQLTGTPAYKHIQHWMAGISLSTGKLVFERRVDPLANGNPYDVAALLQRPALTLSNGRVYAEYGGLYGDCGNYHGYVVGVAVSGQGALSSYQVPTQREGAIWATDGAVVDPTGDLYVATGNGSQSNPHQSFDYGNAVIELSPTLHKLGYWAPKDWAALNGADLDIGSGGPIVVPGTNRIFEAGKTDEFDKSVGYLVTEGRLGQIGGQAFKGAVCSPGGSGVFGSNASLVVHHTTGSTIYLYVACSNGTEALVASGGAHPSFHQAWTASDGSPDGSPVVAGGLVWAVNYDGSTLYGMSPTTGHVLVTRGTDPLEHFVSVGVGDGMLFVPTSHGVQAFYGPSGLPSASTTKLVLTSSPAAPSAGGSVRLTASISPAPLGGTVTFTSGGAAAPGCGRLVVSAAGRAHCTLSGLRQGTLSLRATYTGDAAYRGSSGSESVVVGKVAIR
jgi:outer membrane protein assembly factor BamB